MSNQYYISVSFDEQSELQCMVLGENEPGLGFNTDGISWCEKSEALLYMDEHHELVIKRIGTSHIELERHGRKHELQINHPMRVLSNDIIRMTETSSHTFDIRRVYYTKSPLKQFGRLSKMAMIAFATSVAMMCNVGCSHPTPNHPTQSTQNDNTTDTTTSQQAADEQEQLESELVEDVDIIPYSPMGVMVQIPLSDLIREPEFINNISDPDLTRDNEKD